MVRYAVANTPYFCTLFNSHSLVLPFGQQVHFSSIGNESDNR